LNLLDIEYLKTYPNLYLLLKENHISEAVITNEQTELQTISNNFNVFESFQDVYTYPLPRMKIDTSRDTF